VPKPMTVVALLTALLVWYESMQSHEAPETYDLTKYRPRPRKW
jgi:hypothetical protein